VYIITDARPIMRSNKIRSVDVIYPMGIIVNVSVKIPKRVSIFMCLGFRTIRRAPGTFGIVMRIFGIVQGTFGIVQGTFGIVQETFGIVQGTFGIVQGTFGIVQGTLPWGQHHRHCSLTRI
jgi:hypothetical protein